MQHFWLKIAGYYADPEAECQVFHICTAGANGADGALSKYSFLCPNGTIFNQNYFICDWWFNFDCAEAADLYSLNDDIASERDAAAGALDSYGAATESRASYGAPEEKAAEEYAAPADYDYGVAADYSEAADAYAAPTEVDLNALPVYEEQATYEGEAAAPGAVVEVREGRRFRGGRQGRRGGRRQNRRGGRGRQGRRGFRGWIVPPSFLSSTFWSLSYPLPITCLYCNLNFGAKIVINWSIVVTILSSKSLSLFSILSQNSLPLLFLFIVWSMYFHIVII